MVLSSNGRRDSHTSPTWHSRERRWLAKSCSKQIKFINHAQRSGLKQKRTQALQKTQNYVEELACALGLAAGELVGFAFQACKKLLLLYLSKWRLRSFSLRRGSMNACVSQARVSFTCGRSNPQRSVLHAPEITCRKNVAAFLYTASPQCRVSSRCPETLQHPQRQRRTVVACSWKVWQDGGFQRHQRQQVKRRYLDSPFHFPSPAPLKVVRMDRSRNAQGEPLRTERRCRCQARLFGAILPHEKGTKRSARLVSAAASSSSDAGMDEGPSSSQANCDVDTVGDALLQWKMARMTEGGRSLDWGRYHLQVHCQVAFLVAEAV